MTNDETKALGLRAMAAGFRWAPGVLYRTGLNEYREAWRCFAPPERNIVGDGIGPWFVNGVGDVYSMEEESAPLALIYHPWPDFRDPATLGVLLAQVREALRCPWLYVTPTGGRRQSDGALLWEWRGMANGKSAKGWGWPSEAEALVVALEAAT